MTPNMHIADRTVRALIAAAILLAWALNWISGTLAIVLAVVAVIFLATSLINFCPLYRILGIRTGGSGPKTGAAR
jgi:hypothetical protein